MSELRALYMQVVDAQRQQELDPRHIRKVAVVQAAIKEINRDGGLEARLDFTGDAEGFVVSLRSSGGFISAEATLKADEVEIDADPAALANTIVLKAAESKAASSRSTLYQMAARAPQ